MVIKVYNYNKNGYWSTAMSVLLFIFFIRHFFLLFHTDYEQNKKNQY